ncbi:MAG: MFS transporter [Dermatophilaceae bacterium]
MTRADDESGPSGPAVERDPPVRERGLERDPPVREPPLERDPPVRERGLERDPPVRERGLERDPPVREPPLERDPPVREPPLERDPPIEHEQPIEHQQPIEPDPSIEHDQPVDGREPPRLLDRRYLPTAIGLVALVTLAAFENRAVLTILPSVVRDLDGWSLFGAATGATVVAFTVAMAWSGGWTDRVGPRPVLFSALAAFVVAQVVSALAPTMAVFVAGRAVSGGAEALIDTSLTVLLARTLPKALRAKVFAWFAAAWVLPSVLGPSVAGALDALAGWRMAFVGPLVVVPIALLLLRPALRAAGRGGVSASDGDGDRASVTASAERRRVLAALLLAVGLATTTFTAPLLARPATRWAGVAVILVGLATVVAGAVRALPRGTARLAPGVPAVVGLRLLVSAAFTGIGGVIPLMLVTTRDASTAAAGVSLTVTGCFWALGSWLNGTDAAQRRLEPVARLRAGHAFIAAGTIGPVLLSLGEVGLTAGMAGWALASFGMGIVYGTLSTEILALAPPEEHGRASAAQGLAVSTGVAMQTAGVGAVVAWLGSGIDGTAFAMLMASGGLVAVLAALGSGRARPA